MSGGFHYFVFSSNCLVETGTVPIKALLGSPAKISYFLSDRF